MSFSDVVISSRHPVVLQDLKSVLDPQDDFRVVATCDGVDDFVRTIESLAPDIALVDNCPCNRVELQIIFTIARSSTVLVFMVESSEAAELEALAAIGICHLIPKEADANDMLRLLRELKIDKKVLYSPEQLAVSSAADGAATRDINTILTARELEVMELVSQGLSNKDIARRLRMSHGTVKVHLHHIYRKLEIHNRTLLAALAIGR